MTTDPRYWNPVERLERDHLLHVAGNLRRNLCYFHRVKNPLAGDKILMRCRTFSIRCFTEFFFSLRYFFFNENSLNFGTIKKEKDINWNTHTKEKKRKNRSQLLFKRLGSGSNNLYIYKSIYALYISEKKSPKMNFV